MSLDDKEARAREDLARSERARAIIEDPLVIQALDDIESEVMERWKATDASETDARERLHLLYRTSIRFRTVFENHLTTGKVAKADLLDVERERGILDRVLNRSRDAA